MAERETVNQAPGTKGVAQLFADSLSVEVPVGNRTAVKRHRRHWGL